MGAEHRGWGGGQWLGSSSHAAESQLTTRASCIPPCLRLGVPAAGCAAGSPRSLIHKAYHRARMDEMLPASSSSGSSSSSSSKWTACTTKGLDTGTGHHCVPVHLQLLAGANAVRLRKPLHVGAPTIMKHGMIRANVRLRGKSLDPPCAGMRLQIQPGEPKIQQHPGNMPLLPPRPVLVAGLLLFLGKMFQFLLARGIYPFSEQFSAR
jgi:hypothetical protein